MKLNIKNSEDKDAMSPVTEEYMERLYEYDLAYEKWLEDSEVPGTQAFEEKKALDEFMSKPFSLEDYKRKYGN